MCKSKLGKLIKSHREAAGVSQDQLSKTIGFANRSQVCRLESGTIDWKAVDLIKAADALGIPDSEVLGALRESCRVHR